MNSFIMVWVLVTVSPVNLSVAYSPAMADRQTCEFLQKQVSNLPTEPKTVSQCVQIKIKG